MREAEAPLLSCRALTVRYGGRTALVDFEIELHRGRLTGMIGPDGAGKSTALKTLCGLVDPSGGSIEIEGREHSRSRRRLSRLIGYMPQRFSLYVDLTIDENISFYARLHGIGVDRARHLEMLDKMGLAGFGGRLAGRLSGGMKQKLALLCVLVHEPRLIIMDEPTTGVDPASRREFWRILGELAAQGMGILVATPYLDEAERCHEVLVMHEGRTILRGDPDALVAGMGTTIFEIPAEDGFDLRARLETLEWVRTVQVFGNRLHVTAREASVSVRDIRQRLGAMGIDAGVSEAIPTLEDVFIEEVTR